MEVQLRHRNLRRFDAQVLCDAHNTHKRDDDDDDATNDDTDNDVHVLRLLRTLDLSHNALRRFAGGAALPHVTTLDLSHNALRRLDAADLPPQLHTLRVSHNERLTQLTGMREALLHLRELHAGHTALDAAVLADVPAALVVLAVPHSRVRTLHTLPALPRLTTLDVRGNPLDDVDACLAGLSRLTSLRRLTLPRHLCRSAPAAQTDTTTRTAAATATAVAGDTDGHGSTCGATECIAVIVDALPRLTHLNGVDVRPRHERARHDASCTPDTTAVLSSSRTGNNNNSKHNKSTMSHSSSDDTADTASSATTAAAAEAMRRLRARVAELRRMAAEAQSRELQTRQRRALLRNQVRCCADVIDEQARELTQLQHDIAALRQRERALRAPVQQLEQSFEQTHALVLAHKLQQQQQHA